MRKFACLFAGAFSLLVLFLVAGQAQAEPSNNAPVLVTQAGHTDEVYYLGYRNDGHSLFSAGADGAVKQWDVETGQLLRTFMIEGTKEISQDGRYIISTEWDDPIVKITDIILGGERRLITDHKEIINSVAISNDGRTLATGSRDATIKLWDVDTGKEILTMSGHSNTVTYVAFGPDDQTLVSGSIDNTAKLWDVQAGRELRTFAGHKSLVYSVGFSPDGKTVLTASWDHTMRLWDVSTGGELRQFTGHSDNINYFAFSPDGEMLVSASSDKTLKVWDVETGREIRSIGDNSTALTAVAFSPDGRTVVSGGNDSTIQIWDVTTGVQYLKLLGVGTRRTSDVGASVAFSPDGSTIAATRGEKIDLWDVKKGRIYGTLLGHTAEVDSIAFGQKGKLLFSGSKDNTLKIWDIEIGKAAKFSLPHSESVENIWFNADSGTAILWKGFSDTAWLFNTTRGDRGTIRFDGNDDLTKLLAINSAGSQALHSGYYFDAQGNHHPGLESLLLYDVGTGALIRKFDGSQDSIDIAAFSLDGKRVVTGGMNSPVVVWDVKTGRAIHSFGGQHEWYYSLDFSSDGEYVLVSTGAELQLLGAETGKIIRSLGDGEAFYKYATFSQNGQYVVARDSFNTLHIVRTDNGSLLAKLKIFEDGQWVVIDSAGRFDSSDPNNNPNLHWVVGLTPIPLDQLKDRYYEPGLLSKVMGFNKEPLRPVPDLASALVGLFPKVVATQSATSPNRIDIALTDQGGGFGRVRVRLNGKEIIVDARAGQALTGETAHLAVDIDPSYLLPGDNAVEVQAWNAQGFLRSRPAILTLNGAQARGLAKADNASLTATAEAPTLHAIVAGVSTYANPEMNLSFSGKDAHDFAQALEVGALRLFGAGKVNIHLLSDYGDTGQSPTRENLRAAFAEVARQSKPTDIVVVYMAGHGVMSPGDDGDYYYLTREAQSLNLMDPTVRDLSGVSATTLAQWIKEIKAAKQVMLLDTCASGGVMEKLSAARTLSSSQIRALDRLQERSGFYVLAGSAADRVSYEASQYGQGLLTYSLLEGIKNSTALRDNEFIDVVSLFEYASQRVPQLAEGIGGVQRPQLLAVQGSSFDIGQVTRDDQSNIPLSQIKPLLVRAVFQDEMKFNDHLRLGVRFNQMMKEASFASVRGGPKVVFVDADEVAGAWSLAGRYQKTSSGWQLRANLFRGEEERPLELTLPEDPDQQVEVLHKAVLGLVAGK